LIVFTCALVGLVLTFMSDIVPFRMSIWDAASPASSHVFLLVGALFVVPAVIGYSAYSYRVFRGEDARGWVGRMNERRYRILWLAALYAAGLVMFLLVTTIVKASLKLLR
jgi:cytochrome bd-type quinol oxidase subunit 2